MCLAASSIAACGRFVGLACFGFSIITEGVTHVGLMSAGTRTPHAVVFFFAVIVFNVFFSHPSLQEEVGSAQPLALRLA